MYGRIAIILALLVYVAAVGCSLWSADVDSPMVTRQAVEPQLVPIAGLQSFIGVAMQLHDVWAPTSTTKPSTAPRRRGQHGAAGHPHLPGKRRKRDHLPG